jgi:hypothetical protein
MATTLTYGFQRPASGDKGSVFWPILEDNITQLNAHSHNGTDSALLSAASSVATQQTVTNVGWVLDSGGLYKQTVTMPSVLTSTGGTYDKYSIEIRDGTTGRRLLLSIEFL